MNIWSAAFRSIDIVSDLFRKVTVFWSHNEKYILTRTKLSTIPPHQNYSTHQYNENIKFLETTSAEMNNS